jgi:sensor histidine kinase YesM
MGINKSSVIKGIVIVAVVSTIPTVLESVKYYVFGIWRGNMEPGPDDFIFGALYSISVTVSIYTGCTVIIHWLNQRIPWKNNVVKRLSLGSLLIFGYASLIQVLVIYAFSYAPCFRSIEITASFLFENIVFGNTITLIVITIIEGKYFFNQWKESLVVAEKLKGESLKSQYNSLKSQLDPHFLFNSLNVLSSLIRKDAAKAELFVDDFAKVYRYVLEVKNEMVVKLRSEIDFLEAFVNLQKIRFGDGLHVQIDLPSDSLHAYVPPLSLQELVSNAIKHNTVDEEKPLLVKVEVEDGFLVVKNNLQLRQEEVSSTGLGLENLEKRYQLISDRLPEFKVMNHTFMAKIPLLKEE